MVCPINCKLRYICICILVRYLDSVKFNNRGIITNLHAFVNSLYTPNTLFYRRVCKVFGTLFVCIPEDTDGLLDISWSIGQMMTSSINSSDSVSTLEVVSLLIIIAASQASQLAIFQIALYRL